MTSLITLASLNKDLSLIHLTIAAKQSAYGTYLPSSSQSPPLHNPTCSILYGNQTASRDLDPDILAVIEIREFLRPLAGSNLYLKGRRNNSGRTEIRPLKVWMESKLANSI